MKRPLTMKELDTIEEEIQRISRAEASPSEIQNLAELIVILENSYVLARIKSRSRLTTAPNSGRA